MAALTHLSLQNTATQGTPIVSSVSLSPGAEKASESMQKTALTQEKTVTSLKRQISIAEGTALTLVMLVMALITVLPFALILYSSLS